MSKIDYDWVRAQFQKAHVKIGPGNAVLDLLKEWEKHDLEHPLDEEAVDLFGKLALGHSLVPENDSETWVDVLPGSIRKGQKVRVKANAFDGEAGRLHNGRQGKVVDIRFGDIIFRSEDNQEPFLDGVHYSPYKLQMKVRG